MNTVGAAHERNLSNTLTWLFVTATVCIVTLFRLRPASHLWLPVALGAIALAIWHGAYDAVLAQHLWQPRFPGRWLLPFLVSYVSLAVVVVAAWWWLPVLALVAFLLYSSVHFGTEQHVDREPVQLAGAAAFGFLPIAAACHWQASAVVPIFVAMLRGRCQAADHIAAAAGAALLPCVLLAAITAGRHGYGRRAILIVSELLLFRVCPPVVAFAVFFCTLHTPEHLVETSRDALGNFSMRCMWRNLRQGIAPWLISLAAIVVAAWLGRQALQAYTGMLFIALSALTVPHMVLAAQPGAVAHPGHGHPLQAPEWTAAR